MSAGEALTPQQRAFCEQYVANGRNGTQAAIAAGYGAKSAHVRASKLLAMPKIQEFLAELVIPAAAKALDELGKVARAQEVREQELTAREGEVAREETLEELRDRVKAAMIKSLCGMAFTSMADLASWTESGVQFVPSAELTPEQIEAIETIESHVSEGESQDGKSLYRNAFLKIKRHDRRGAMKDLRELLELGPRKPAFGEGSKGGPAVLVVVAGGPTGMELGAQVGVYLQPGAAVSQPPVTIVPAPAGAGAGPNVPRATGSAPAAPEAGAKALRSWNPGPKKPAKGGPARAIVSTPTGQ